MDFSPGSLGPPPQTYNGQAAMVIVTVVALVVVFVAMFVLALAATVLPACSVPGTTQHRPLRSAR